MKNINRIFLFGDSWVEGQGTYEKISPEGFLMEPNISFNEIGDWRKKNSWNKFIKEYTDCEVINKAMQGSSNSAQFQELNNKLNIFTKTDLILFGFTSKLRDRDFTRYAFDFDYSNILLHQKNPLKGMVAWEKASLEFCNFGFREDAERTQVMQFNDTIERNFTEKFISDYFSTIYDEYPFEYISQVNYLFYQERFKTLGLNIIFFDLFEPYVNPKFVKKYYNVDKNIYINYGDKTMNDFLIEYEIKNVKDDDIGVWQNGIKRPDLKGGISHPNQHGYKLIVDYLFQYVLPKQYKFIK